MPSSPPVSAPTVESCGLISTTAPIGDRREPLEEQTMTAIEETARDITLKVIEQQAYGPISDDASEAIRIGEYAVALYRTILEGVRGAHESAQSGVGAARPKRT